MWTKGEADCQPLGEGIQRIPGPPGFARLKLVDVGHPSRAQVPSWVVRRAARLVVEHREQLDLEELANIAMALLREADGRLSPRVSSPSR